MSCYRFGFAMVLAMGAMTAASSRALAVSYASNITKTGTTVNFVLNSPADILSYSINGGAPVTLDGSTKGAKTFNLVNANDTFSIVAERTDAVGYSIETGATIGVATSGLTAITDEGGLNVISDDTSALNRFSNPRGVSVSLNPNAPNFGVAYVANSANTTGTSQLIAAAGAFPERTVTGDGLYALRADGADAFSYGDTAKNPIVEGFPAWVASSNNSPFRNYVADDGKIYVSDFSDANGSVIQVEPDLNTAVNVFPGFGGPATLPSGQNHGSTTAVHVEGSIAGGNLKVYTLDEDLTSAQFGGASTTDINSLWQYDIGSGPLPSAVIPTKMATVLLGFATSDMHRGADGKWYLTQFRANRPNETALFVLSADGTTVLYNSLDASRTLVNDPLLELDILQNIQGVAVSVDQKWIAMMLNNSDVAVVPLIDGIPDLANRKVINTAEPNVNSGRDITFDAAGNIHYVSSGQGVYRVIAPGGHTKATTSWNGTEFVFGVETITTTPGLAGDFNSDNVVDGADFLVWQRGGSPNPLSTGDLDLWKAHFGDVGSATGSVGAVPEPSSLIVSLLAMAGFATFRRRVA
ncbi:MAG: PEP-CTERM sorting domain-containing protein [Planctomycetaceae bacterium]|nr:PEP-CTERM sorting domain-containing protein [Planctomycetaceae bacterium]